MSLPHLSNFRSVLVVKPSSLGDIVHTLPAVHAIKAAHPHLRIRWIAKPEWLPLIKGVPCVDEAIPFPQAEFRGLGGFARAALWTAQWNKLPREEPELVLDFQGLLRSGLICLTSGSAPVIGLSDAREGASRFYDHTVQVDAGAHAVDRYLAIPQALGIPAAEAVFSLPAGDPVEVPQRFVLIHPFSRGAGKSLGNHELQVLCDCLTTVPVVVVGVPPGPLTLNGRHVLNLAGQTSLHQLIWLMRKATMVISVDSGPMHIAAAVNDATLGLHTWSDPRRVGPYNPHALVWKAGRIAPRGELSPEECLADAAISEGDARRIADFVLRRLG
ncbi:MAG: hypothetical protein JWO94_2789 [Verrucomicrobiaceae bacterium]|nr:hypothetical protein [Verrucomicrobiaceae bacterium]